MTSVKNAKLVILAAAGLSLLFSIYLCFSWIRNKVLSWDCGFSRFCHSAPW